MTQPIKPGKRRTPRSPHAKLFGTGDLNPILKCSVIVAHPADEVVGAGCLISKLVDVTVLHITDGAPCDMQDAKAAGFKEREEYAAARKRECISALAMASVPEDRIIDFEVPNHCASNYLAELTKRITTFLQQSGADIVVTHPYEGGHPDHDATAFATHAALRLMKRNGFRPPALFEMALHPSTDSKAKVPEFLPGAERETTTLLLDERAMALKQRMFACFQSQRESLEVSPFGPEKFRQPVAYDFTTPPQEGKLHYESFDWAPRSDEWQSLARQALADLFPRNAAAH
ncbi:MAG: PIG-L family deacetylase [Pyrinomonadaceae bacterium]|nr:PIG-L family deacetylase [Pyrinomonadaceae bacterium]